MCIRDRWWPTNPQRPASSMARRPGWRWPAPGRSRPTRPHPIAGSARLIDRLGDLQPFQDPPDPGQVTELLVLGALRATGRGAGQAGHHFGRAAQILLIDDAWLAVHPAGLHQVVVGLVPALLPNNLWHMWVIHLSVHHVQHRHAYL